MKWFKHDSNANTDAKLRKLRTCAYCGQRGGRLECDNIIPVSRGGLHDDVNLTTSCFTCNRKKRTKTAEEFMQ